MASPARVVNRGLLAATVVVLLVTGAVAIWGDHANAPSHDSHGSSSVPPTTVPGLTGARPANTQGSWFSANGEAEQYDYPMNELSCDALNKYLNTNLCAVANTTRGSMMFVATEGYWDPNEPDTDGIVRIPLYFQVFMLTKKGGPARATSVLDGELYADYEINEDKPDSVSLSTIPMSGDPIFAVRYRTWYGRTLAEHVQFVAMNANGAPEMMAAYRGDNMRIAAGTSELYVAADRYGPPRNGDCCDNYSTVWTIAPDSSPEVWRAVEQSQSDATKMMEDATAPTLVDIYDFPQKYGTAASA